MENYWTRNTVRRRRFLQGAALTSVGAAGALAVGCGNDDDDEAPPPTSPNGGADPEPTEDPGAVQRGGDLIIRRATNLAFWDPQRASGGFDPPITDLYATRLLDITADGELRPNLASDWEQTDESTVTLHLREDILFGDGTPFNAEAVRYAVERGASPELGAPPRPSHSQVESMDTPDEHTIVFHLAGPNATWLETLSVRAGTMISPTAHEELGDERFNQSPVGAGPYRVERIVDDGESVFVRNEDWPMTDPNGGQLPYLDRVLVRVMPEDAVSIGALGAGEIDLDYVVEIPNVAQVDAQPGMHSMLLEDARFNVAEFATNVPPTDIVALRRAVNYAIDREETNQALAMGLGAPARGPLTHLSWAHDDALEGFAYDPAQVQEQLELAGFPDGIDLRCATYAPEQAELLQAQLARHNIRLEVDNLELAVYQDQFRAQGNYSVATAGGPVPQGDPYEFFLTRYSSVGAFNPGRPSYPEWDELIDKAALTFDQEERAQIYSELQYMDHDWAFRAWIINIPRAMGLRDNVEGLTWIGYNPDLRLAWKS